MGWLRILLLVVAGVIAGCSNSIPEQLGSDSAETSDPSPSAPGTSSTSAPASPEPDQGGSSAETNDSETVPFAVDAGLRWTVLAVRFDDVLNVRAQPDPSAAKVGALAPWQTDLTVSAEKEINGDGSWRRVVTDDGTTGWVNARFLVAQPVEYRGEVGDELFLLAADVLADEPRSRPEEWLAEKALWVGGIGVYADASSSFEWVPRGQLLDASDWAVERTFTDPLGADDCGTDCVLSVRAFLGLDRFTDRAELTIPPVSPGVREFEVYQEGVMATVPDTLQWVRVYEPGTPHISLDWMRLGLIFDHAEGQPKLKAVHIWGWTP